MSAPKKGFSEHHVVVATAVACHSNDALTVCAGEEPFIGSMSAVVDDTVVVFEVFAHEALGQSGLHSRHFVFQQLIWD